MLPFPVAKEATSPSQGVLFDPLRDQNGSSSRVPSGYTSQPVEQLQSVEWGCSHAGRQRSHRLTDSGMWLQ